jgi:ABC-type multidrug transport system fused ATPase/permease subunit
MVYMKKFKRPKLPKPKITFDRFGQIYFTFKEATKLAFRTNPKLLIQTFVLNALWGLLAVPGFYLQKLILDRLVNAIGAQDIIPYVYSIGFIIGLALLLSLFRNFLGSYNGFLRRSMARYLEVEIEVLLGKKVSELDMATIDDPEFQDKFKKIESESGRRAWGLVMPLSNIPNFSVGFLSAVGILVLLHPLIAAGVFLVALPQIFIDSKYIKKGYKLSTQLSPLRRMWGWLGYYLVRNQNFMELKLLGISSHLSSKLRDIVYDIVGRRTELSKQREYSRFGSYLPLTVFEFVVSIILIIWVIIRRITIGSFQLYLSSLRSAEQNLTSLVSSFLEVYENYIYVTDLVWFLNLESKIEKTKRVKVSAKEKVKIEFDGVWFKYRDDQPWVIKDVSFTIEHGERAALVGVNGAGKSTLIKLIAGFYHPQKGKILVNGMNLTKIDIKDWRQKLSVLFQQFESYIFSVREAIGYGDVKRLGDLSGIKDAAKQTGVDEFIEGLPLKYKNPLSPRFDKGVKPSIGQLQRIGISRMLFRKGAKALILDEPTSNVDPEAEEKIFKMLVKKTKNKVLIFVTQRFSTVRIADRIFVVDKGKIIEDGTHKELMAKDGKYAKLFTLQAQAYLS